MPIGYIIILLLVGIIIIFLYLVEPLISRQKIRNNNEHGSARWANKKEINDKFRKEEVSNINTSGFPVYYSKNNKYVWFDNETPHWIYLGSTGSGKSVTAVIPQCSFIATAKVKKSVFITDPKGEIFNTTSKMFKNNGYNILTIDFRNPSLSNHLNILEPIICEYEKYSENDKLSIKAKDDYKKIKYQNKAIEHLAECNQLIESISRIIMEDKTAKEAFWNNSASDLLYGLISLFLEEYIDGKIKRKQITLSSIKKFQNSSMTETNHKLLKMYVEEKPYGFKSKDKLLPVISTSDTTYKSITSVFNERMSLFDDINVENITSNSDFAFDILGKEKTVLYCCIPDESKIYYSLVSIIVSLIYKTLVLLSNNQPNKRLPYDLVFLLDEFANTPPLEDIETIVSVARSRGMYFQFFLQSFAQLDNLYGKEVSQIIQDNCGLAYLKTNTEETAESISKRLGNKTIETSTLNYSMSFTNNNGSKGTSLMARNLMTADEIKQLHYKTIIFPTISHPIIRDTVVYKKFSCYKEGAIKRKIRPLARLTDTYFTVEDINFDAEENTNNVEPNVENEIEAIRNNLTSIMNAVAEAFGKIDYTMDFKENNKTLIGLLYLAPPLSYNDILGLDKKSDELKFMYNIITDKEKINKKSMNTLVEIEMLEEVLNE